MVKRIDGNAPAGVDWLGDLDSVKEGEVLLALYKPGEKRKRRPGDRRGCNDDKMRLIMIRRVKKSEEVEIDDKTKLRFLAISPTENFPDFYVYDPALFARINLPEGYDW